ncbi:hypothetical protein [Methanobrevibacter sp.]|uniref:hypothetical protein n=1 Tax=Methanobrevibacter sp. TaxID=66852 RepID=UPI00388E9715
MSNMKTKFLVLSLIILLFLSVYAITAAENDDVITDTQDLKLSEDTVTDVKLNEDSSDDALLSQVDTDSRDDIADEKPVNTKNKLGAGKSKVTVIFHKMSSEGEVTDSVTNEISSTWGIGMAKFNNQVANKKYSDFVYENEHWVFDHWEDADGNKITGTQTIVATGEDFEVHYYAKYTHTPLGTLRVTYNDNFGHGSGSMNYTDHNTAYKHTFKVPADYPEDKVVFKYWEREDTGEKFNAGDSLTVKPSEFDGKELNITVNAIYDIKTVVTLDEVTDYTGNVVDITAKVEDAFGNPLNGGTATLTIDYDNKLGASAETYTAEVKDGKAEFKDITLGAPGTYPSKVEYTGYDDPDSSEGRNAYLASEGESKVNILPLNTTTESDDVSGTVGEKVDITADITDQNGDPVQNGTAVLKINGKEYTAEVKDGKATFTGVELPSESTEATIEYQGNDYYNPSNTTIKVTVTVPEEPDQEDDSSPEPDEPSSDSNDTDTNGTDSNPKEPKHSKIIEKAKKALPAAGNPILLLAIASVVLGSAVSLRRKK